MELISTFHRQVVWIISALSSSIVHVDVKRRQSRVESDQLCGCIESHILVVWSVRRVGNTEFIGCCDNIIDNIIFTRGTNAGVTEFNVRLGLVINWLVSNATGYSHWIVWTNCQSEILVLAQSESVISCTSKGVKSS